MCPLAATLVTLTSAYCIYNSGSRPLRGLGISPSAHYWGVPAIEGCPLFRRDPQASYCTLH